LRQGNIALIHSAPTGENGITLPDGEERAFARSFDDWRTSFEICGKTALGMIEGSMPALGFLHRRELLGTGRTLMGGLPGLIGHAVDSLAALVLAHRQVFGVGFVLEPIGQAVAAEACEVHQIDILDVAAGAQMLDKAPEHRGFKFCSGFVVKRHRGISPVISLFHGEDIDIKWELSQILPHRSAKRAQGAEFSAIDGLKPAPRRSQPCPPGAKSSTN
jgi:hypothetical protein